MADLLCAVATSFGRRWMTLIEVIWLNVLFLSVQAMNNSHKGGGGVMSDEVQLITRCHIKHKWAKQQRQMRRKHETSL